MGVPSMFKSNKPKRFNFIPRYYDERKEALNDRVRQVQSEMGISQSDENYKPTISRGTLKQNFSRRKKIERSSTIRLLVIVAILLFIATYLIYM